MNCCQSFENLLATIGQKGLSIVLKSQMGMTFFCLQGRACDSEDMAKVEGQQLGAPVKLRLVEQIAIKHCPFCGFRLAGWIENNAEKSIELAKRSESFVM